MRIKNTRELVLRAQAHARHDHVEQGTYGEGSTNGHVEFKGCAIGCLATPHREKELRGFIRVITKHGWYSDGADNMLARLKSEFGIVPELARCAEAIFESLPFHGGAIEFIPAFAKALPEGVNISPRDVRRAWDRINGRPMDLHGRTFGTFCHVGPEQARDELLAWLEGLKVA